MRIFILASWYPSTADPIHGLFVEEQALALARRHQVVVMAPEQISWRGTWLPGNAPKLWVEQRRGIDVVRVRTGTPVPWSWRARQAAYVEAARRAFREAVQAFGRPDLLHAHVVLPGGDAALRVGREAGIPVVLTEHSNPFSMNLRDPGHRGRTDATLAGVDAVVAVSPFMRDQILAFRPQTEIAVCGNAIDTEFFRPAPTSVPRAPAGEFKVLSVGLLTPSKGMNRVIEGVAMAASRVRRDVTLTIVGDGPERGPLEAQAKRTAIARGIRFAGSLDRAGVRDAMRVSDAFVLGSESETFGVVLAEAMACGCPVIATRSGGSEWVVEPGCGLLVPIEDPSAIADAIVGVVRRRAAIDVRKARRSIVERFGLEAVASQLETVYGKVLSRRQQP